MPSSFLLTHGIALAIGLSIVGLVFALILIRKVVGAPAGNAKMQEIALAIQQGAKAYLNRQIMAVSVIAVLVFAAVWWLRGGLTAAGFVVGAVCSLAAGYIGMMIAVRANVRTAQAASVGSHPALKVAFNGGAVTGLLVVALGLLSVGVFYLVVCGCVDHAKHAIDSLVGLALGSSLISVFARLGGGIYTKAADVGADLVGKNEQNLNEDDPRNPATIADNVGDNVGDCAGMAADVFETYAVSLIGGVLVGHLTVFNPSLETNAAVVYPFVLCGLAIIASLIGIGWVNFIKQEATASLVCGVAVSGIVASGLFWWATAAIFPEGLKLNDGMQVSNVNLFYCAGVGLVMTLLVVWITNYYTSTHHKPVRLIAKASETGPATNIIAGISIGNQATLLPVLAIAAAIWGCYDLAGLYGIAIAVVSMLSLSGIIISLDAFGPITDNAGGIAVMAGLPESVRKITDELDAVGNKMKAVTKGYAIASAGLAAMVLFGSYVEDLQAFVGHKVAFDLMDHRVVIGMFIGGLLPFLFTSFCMSAVGSAAGAVVREVRRQITAKPGILTGTETPDYAQCVDIVTKAALGQMIVPALLPLIFVIAVAFLGMEALGGVLIGTIVTGLFVGISMTSAGGAWDNAKKFIEEGNHGGKGSFAHQAAVTGDTVGDPYKDTAGPAVNPMIKVVNILAILIIPIAFKAAVK